MKRFLFLSLALFSFQLKAQTFTINPATPIPDNAFACAPILVSGLPAAIDSNFGFCQITVNITHTYDSDIDLWIKSPWGDSVKLSDNRGGGDDNYTNTVFRMDAPDWIYDGNAPFTGNFIPENSLNLFNQGNNPNGTWTFCVHDEVPADVGTINSVSLNFCSNPPADPPPAAGPCSFANGFGCECPDSSQDCDLMPDMTASADIIAAEHTENPGILYLSNATPNIGWGPMEIHGSNNCFCDTVPVSCSTVNCPNGDPPTQQLIQTYYHKTNGTLTPVDYLTPGTMSYHPSHGHVHVDNWAEFTIRTPTSNPDATTWPILGTGSKVSFCLINLGDCTNNFGYCRDASNNIITMADIPNAGLGQVSGCGNDQGIYTGMLDIYDQGLPGMFIDLTGICNGNYYIVSVTDPDNNFLETDETNNWCAVPITLTQQAAAPSASFIWSQVGNTYSFSFTPNASITSYTWDFGDGTTDNTNNPTSHTYPTDGNYTVTLTINSSCGEDSSTQTLSFVGLSGAYAYHEYQLAAFPNPTTGQTNLSFVMPAAGNAQLQVLNLLGQPMMSLDQGNLPAGNHSVAVDFEKAGLANGTYFLKLVTENASPTLLLQVLR